MTKIWWNGNRVDAPEGWNRKEYAGVYLTDAAVSDDDETLEIEVGARLIATVLTKDITILEPRKYPPPMLPH